jgi:hypothetical protein
MEIDYTFPWENYFFGGGGGGRGTGRSEHCVLSGPVTAGPLSGPCVLYSSDTREDNLMKQAKFSGFDSDQTREGWLSGFPSIFLELCCGLQGFQMCTGNYLIVIRVS